MENQHPGSSGSIPFRNLVRIDTGENMTAKIMVIDDHPVVIDGLRFALTPSSGIEIVSARTTLKGWSDELTRNRPDVLVTEVRLGGQDVLREFEANLERLAQYKVIAFSAESNPTHIARAAAIGFHDYILKTQPVSELFRAVKRAASGNDAPETSLMVQTQRRMRRPRQSFSHDIPLTNREMQVLRHIAMGLSNREIGKSLAISVETVKEHVQNILRKLDVNDRTQAAVWAVKRGLT